jgi:hypothetical protein
MKAPWLPEGFDYREFDGIAFWETTRCDEQGMPICDENGIPYGNPPIPIDREEKRVRFCLHCLSPQRGRFIYRISTHTVSGIDWQCLCCYERSGGKGLRKNELLEYCTVVEDRRCRSCWGYGCQDCQTLKCSYVDCETPYLNVHEHHTSPKAMFDDADNWPLIPLCSNHHKIWHATIKSWLMGSCNYY